MLVRWTTPATRDLTEIAAYIQEHAGPARARRVALTIFDRVQTLTQFPNSGRVGRIANTRELVIVGLPFLAVYRVHREAVEVIRILHGAQKWP